MGAYERLLGEAMKGDATLFAREDYVEEAWRIVDPVLKTATPVFDYEPQTWGPAEAEPGDRRRRRLARPKPKPCSMPSPAYGLNCASETAINAAIKPLMTAQTPPAPGPQFLRGRPP